jgi:hypothetical protein
MRMTDCGLRIAMEPTQLAVLRVLRMANIGAMQMEMRCDDVTNLPHRELQ